MSLDRQNGAQRDETKGVREKSMSHLPPLSPSSTPVEVQLFPFGPLIPITYCPRINLLRARPTSFEKSRERSLSR